MATDLGLDKIWINALKDVPKPSHKKGGKDAVQRVYDKDNKKQVQKLIDGLPDDLKSKPLFAEDVLNRLSREHLTAICDVVSKINSSKGTTARKALIQVLDQQSTAFIKYAEVGDFGQGKFDTLADGIDKGNNIAELGRSSPSKADLELVAAFRMIGLNLVRNGNEWKLPVNDKDEVVYEDRGIEVVGAEPREFYRFSKEQLDSLLKNYLNSHDRQGKVITPDGLFQVYRNVAEKANQDSKDVGKDVKDSRTTAILATKDILSTQSQDWAVELLTDDALIQLQARKVALSQVYAERFKDVKAEEIEQAVWEDPIIAGSKPLKEKLLKLEAQGKKAVDFIREHETHSIESPLSLYDTQIKVLETTRNSYNSAKIDEQILRLKMAKYQLECNIAYQRSYLDDYLETKSATKDDILKRVQEGAKYTIVIKEGKRYLIDNQSGVEVPTDDAMNVKINKYLRHDDQENTQEEQEDNEEQEEHENSWEELISEYYPDIFNHFSEGMFNVFSADEAKKNEINGTLKDFVYYNMAAELLRKGGYYRKLFEDEIDPQRQNSEYANCKNDDEKFAVFAHKWGCPEFFTEEMLLWGYTEARIRDGEQIEPSEDFKTKKLEIDNNIKKYIVILDLATQLMSPEEYAQYIDPNIKPEYKQKLIDSKIVEAYRKYDDGKGISEVDEAAALKRHKNNLLGKLINQELCGEAQYGGGIVALDESLGNDEKKSMTDTLHKYLGELAKEQQANNESIQQNEPPNNRIVDLDNKEALGIKEKGNEGQKKWAKYNELYPTPPDNETFQKKMKPYCKKIIVKQFLEPLLKKLRETKIYLGTTGGGSSAPQTDETEKKGGTETPSGVPGSNNAKGDSQTEAGNNPPSQGPVITKSQFDSTLFTVGRLMTIGSKDSILYKYKKERIELDTQRKAGKISEDEYNQKIANLKNREEKEVAPVDNLDFVMSLLSTSSVDMGDKSGISRIHPHYLFDKNNNKDMRNDLRELAFAICRGDIKRNEVEVKLDEIFAKYDCFTKNPDLASHISKIKEGFKLISPAMLSIIFQGTSNTEQLTSNEDGKKIYKVGEKLLKDNKLLDRIKECKTDLEKFNLMRSVYGQEWIVENASLLNFVIEYAQNQSTADNAYDYKNTKFEYSYDEQYSQGSNNQAENDTGEREAVD